MKVALNARALLSPRTGIGQYIHALATELLKTGAVDLEFFYSFGWSRELRGGPLRHIDAVKTSVKKVLPWSYEIVRLLTQVCFTAGAWRKGFDLYHEPNFLAYEFEGPLVLTVHDLSFVRYPELHPAARIEAMARHFPKSLERASIVLTDAESVRREVLERYGLRPERVRSVPLGARQEFCERSPEQIAPTLEKFGLRYRGYLLSVGTLEPRKNIAFVLDAFARLPEKIRRQFPIALVGMEGWLNSDLDRRMRPLVERGEVRLLGYLSDNELQHLYAGASLFIYPSLYEGFGLPALEAMQCGVPVIVSNVSALPEVVGEAGVKIDPADTDALTMHIERLLDDRNEWQRLRLLGLDQAKRFSWHKCASETLLAYRDAVSLG